MAKHQTVCTKYSACKAVVLYLYILVTGQEMLGMYKYELAVWLSACLGSHIAWWFSP